MVESPGQYILYKLSELLGSRKFWVLLFAALAAYGLDIEPELQALLIFLSAAIYAAVQGYEDAARARQVSVEISSGECSDEGVE